MRRLARLFSRISLRLMLFNLLLVFLPVAGVLLLGFYEQNLENAQVESMFRQARLVSALIQTGNGVDPARAVPVLRQTLASDGRFRIVDGNGRIVADSGPTSDTDAGADVEDPVQRNWLYRLGVMLVKKPLQLIMPPPRLPSSDDYERGPVLRGSEVESALLGVRGVAKRVSSAPDRPVTLYVAIPLFQRGQVAGAIVVSRSTDEIRDDIHEIRLAIFRIVMISLVLAMVLTLMVSTTIVQPLRQLRKEAGEILDRRGRLRGRFKGSKKHDEIGDLSRALERLTRRLEQHQQLTESFASDVSHEFKNPLASVRMATEMLAQVDSPAERARFLRVAESEIARMETLLSQVREITLIDAEIQNEERGPVDINTLLPRIVDGFRLREKERVVFDLQTAAGPLIVQASEDRLLQVFENLLDNAVSFTPPGGTIAITTVAGETEALVAIRDHGPGIAGENLDRIFDRFFTYRPEAQHHRHTGLGLSIVKSIVEGYGGAVSAANAADGGAMFEVKLPF